MNEIQRPHSGDLVKAAGERHELSPSSVAALQDSGVLKQIESGMSGSQTATKPGRIMLVTLDPDDSGSIFTDDEKVLRPWTDKSDSIVAGHNELLQGMLDGPEGRRTMLHTRYLNGTVLNPFMPLALCRKMSRSNYSASYGGTPLFGQTLVTLGIVVAKTEELQDRGARVTTATLIMTDGEATDDTPTSRRLLASVVADMRESGHIIAGMGIGRGGWFHQTFDAMGIDPELVFEAKDINAILEAFRMFGRKVHELSAGSSVEVGRPTVFHM